MTLPAGPKPLTEQQETLIQRLNAGYDKIEEASQQGKDTYRLEQFWLGLLEEYEAVVTELNKQPDTTTQKEMFT